jgi:hypothetical protein
MDSVRDAPTYSHSKRYPQRDLDEHGDAHADLNGHTDGDGDA